MLHLILALGLVGSTPTSAVPVQDEPLHRVVHVSEHLRVFDIVIPPHASTLYHIHLNDLVGVTITPGPSRDEKAGASPVDEPPDKQGEVWLAAHPQRDVHRVTNLGDSPIHMVAIELLSSAGATNAPALRGEAAGVVQLDNSKARVVRYSLQPGQVSKAHTHGRYVLVPLGPGRIGSVCGGSESRSVSEAGFLCVGAERQHQISNVGDIPIELLEFEIGP
jgi:quercetin dioxygenase-like cupin family protein